MSEVELHVHEHQVLPRFELRLKESESFVITNYTIGPCIYRSKIDPAPLDRIDPGVLRIPECAHLPEFASKCCYNYHGLASRW